MNIIGHVLSLLELVKPEVLFLNLFIIPFPKRLISMNYHFQDPFTDVFLPLIYFTSIPGDL